MANVVINGSDIFVFIDGTPVAHATSHTLSMNMNTRDTSNKDTGKFNTKAVGRLDVSATAEALVVYTDFSVMANALLDRVPVTVSFGQRSGDVLDQTVFYAEGEFIITSLEMNAADQENASYSCSFEHYSDFTLSDDTTLRASGMVSEDATFAAVFPKGGTAPYTFLWNDTGASTTQYLAAPDAGTYTCTIEDADEATVTVEVVVPDLS